MSSPSSNQNPISFKQLMASITKEKSDGQSLKQEYKAQKKVSDDLRTKLDDARTWDIRVKIGIRIVLTFAFLIILILQNYFVFTLVQQAMLSNQLGDLQLILGTIITGTLVETYFVIKEIVRWAMQEIDYKIVE